MRGLATYYCCTHGFDSTDYVAAAGPALRVGNWRGRIVTVTGPRGTIRVKLVDWCQCYKGTSQERAIDLHPSAFAALGALSLGILKVTIRW